MRAWIGEKLIAPLVFLFATMLSPRLSAADKVTFFLEDEPVYCSSSQANPGFLLEIVMEMSRNMGVHPKIDFLPWKRAQYEAERTPNSVIFPLTRNETRETHYRWICKIFDVPVMFITKEGNPMVDTLEQARQLRKIAVIFGTPQAAKMDEFGLQNAAAMTGDVLYKALASGNADAIYGAKPEAVIGWRQGGYNGHLQFGKTFQTLPLWIATSKKSTAIDDQKWEAALEHLKKSGAFDKIMNKYMEK